VPDYHLQDLGGFLYGKKNWELFTLNMGIRFDHRAIDSRRLILDSLGIPTVSGDTLFPGFRSDFSAFTGSLGMTFRLNRLINFKFNIGRGFRAPNIAELGSNGLHEGTFRYEIGNPDLKSETSLQVDGEIALNAEKINLVFNGFYNLIDHYIYYRNLDGEQKEVDEKSFPVYRYVQGNAVLKGFELELDFHPVEALHFENSADYVWAANRTTETPLPFIPALHTQHTLKWTFETSKSSRVKSPFLQAELELHFRQDRIDTFETRTDGYYLLNASAGMNLLVGRQRWTLFVGGKNLTNVRYYDHLSRLKEVGIYNMGINVTAGLIVPFGIVK
jgi:iron complex outermembrane recepter protein